MPDDELEKLREEKMKKMQEQQQSQEDQLEEQRKNIKQQASKYMTSDAVSRLGNVRAAKPELAHSVEAQVARLGQMGRIEENGMTEDHLKEILRDLQKDQEENEGNISFRR
jgi:programmed cell death protein 5